MIAAVLIAYMAWFNFDQGNDWAGWVMLSFASLITVLCIYNAINGE